MKKFVVAFLLLFSSVGFCAGQTNIFTLDAMTRGEEVINMIATLNSAPYLTSQSEVGIQLVSGSAFPIAPFVIAGFVPYVQSATAAPNDTMMILKYLPRGSIPQYLVVPIEQVSAVVYSQIAIPPVGFGSSFQSYVTPYLYIDPVQRAADVKSIVNTLLTATPYKTPQSTVGILTTLSGPYYPAIVGGLIPRVLSVTQTTPGNTLLLVRFLSPQNVYGTVVVGVEQIIQVVYFPN